MRSKLRIFLSSVISSFLLFSASQAGIDSDLKDAYNDLLINSSNPKVVEGQERGYITLGSIYYRTPRSKVNLLTITPPSIRTGCSGVDFTAGALSYLNADQLVSWLQSTLQAAPAIAFEVALEKYLPGVKSVLNEVSQLAQTVNQMNLDSCQASRKLVYSILGDPSEQQAEKEKQIASNESTKKGLVSDFFASINSMAKDFKSKLDSFFNSGNSAAQKLKEDSKQIRGDYLYNSLQAKYGKNFDEHNAVARLQFRILASLIGDAVLKRKGNATDSPEESELYDLTYVKPTINSVEDLLNVPSPGVGKIYRIVDITDSLGSFKGVDPSSTEDLYTSMKNYCKAVVPSSYMFLCDTNPGLSTVVEANLRNIYEKIITHQPLEEKDKQFVSTCPLPILKWLNVLAYYPSVADTFISNSKDWIATFYLEALISDAFKNAVIIPWRKMPESQKKDLVKLYMVSRDRLKELYEIRRKNKDFIQTFDDFANFVSHFEKSLVVKLSENKIYSNL